MRKTLILLAAVAAFCACDKAEVSTPEAKNADRVVKFTAENLYSFETKAVMVSGNVGIWAGAPINTNNASYTISGSNLTGSSILWGIQQAGTDTPSYFFAKYPYAGGDSFTHSSAALDCSIDVSTGDAKTASVDAALNLMVAATKAAPGTGEDPATVAFSFKHPYAKLVYNVTNNSDDAVNYAMISGVAWSGAIDYAETEAVAPQQLTVTATPTEARTSANPAAQEFMNGGWNNEAGKYVYYTVSLPAASMSPAITIVMFSGATYTFSLNSAITLEAGKVYTANITIDNSHNHGNITNNRVFGATFTETDWTDAASQPVIAAGDGYDNSGIGYWSYVSASSFDGLTYSNFSTKKPMALVGDHLWRTTITFAAAGTDAERKFKLRINDNWVGQTAKTADDHEWAVWTVEENGGDDIANSFAAEGTYTVYFKNYGTKQCYVKAGDQTLVYDNSSHSFVWE